MSNNALSEALGARARALLSTGEFTGPFVRDSGHVGDPIAVMDPGGQVISWAVPVLVGDLLAGFFHFHPDQTLLRWSAFQRREDTLAGCPPAATWLDRSEIRRRAEKLAQPGEIATEPVLSFDGVPDRLAWVVRLIAVDGSERIVYVAGNATWPAAPDASEAYRGR